MHTYIPIPNTGVLISFEMTGVFFHFSSRYAKFKYSYQRWDNSSMTLMIIYQIITYVNILTMFSEDSLSSVILIGKQSML